ncbi:hypothetical protein GGR51DRAFT_40826 [Nemania sp. FL0031]|nr:hypothetical protein GGR51DRAFT_40826 [Nemania sp. FL0031]
MDDPIGKLIDELRSRLDETTILSIASDYDLRNPQEFAAAREVLLAISTNVAAEEATGFNPSGFGGDEMANISLHDGAAGSETMQAIESDLKSNDGLTSTTEGSRSHSRSVLSSTSSKTSGPEIPGILHVSALDNLTTEEKESRLAAMFVCLKPIDIKLTLQKTKGDADLAMDELLNLQLLEQTGQRPKGVDGFYVSDDDAPKVKKKRQKKMKKAPKAAGAPRVATPKSPDLVSSPEESGRDEATDNDNISFISDHFALPVPEATDIYQRNKLSLGAAMLKILDNYIALGWQNHSSPDQLRQREAQEKRVPWIPHDYFSPIFNTTVTSQAAIDVIDALADHFKKPAYLKHNVTYRIAASKLDLAPDTGISPQTGTGTSQRSRTAPATLQEASAAKAAMAASTQHSFASASAAFKKGRSDPLMRQAASFYAERARAEAAGYRGAVSAEAELRVDGQSSGDTVDLHGVSVHDGVQIALDRVRRWWGARSPEEKEKTRRTVRGGDAGLKVVTGLGRHNPDGKSRLRINVFKALVDDGWKVEVLTGAYLVIGRTGPMKAF